MLEWLGPIASFLGGAGQFAGGISGLFGRGGGDGGLGQSTMAQNWRNDDMTFAREQFDWNKGIAQNALQIRMADAKKAGVHPLFGLGGGGAGPSPTISLSSSLPSGRGADGGGSDLGRSLSDMGQGLGRALAAGTSRQDRDRAAYESAARALDLENKRADIELTRARIASEQARMSPSQLGPGTPAVAGPPALGTSQIKPAEVTSTNPQSDGSAEAGPKSPVVVWRADTSAPGAVAAYPARDLNIDDFSSPGYSTWMMGNKLLPFVGQGVKPPPNLLPKWATDWVHHFGSWVPVDRNREYVRSLPTENPYWTEWKRQRDRGARYLPR